VEGSAQGLGVGQYYTCTLADVYILLQHGHHCAKECAPSSVARLRLHTRYTHSMHGTLCVNGITDAAGRTAGVDPLVDLSS
jgi:hypothetical protein